MPSQKCISIIARCLLYTKFFFPQQLGHLRQKQADFRPYSGINLLSLYFKDASLPQARLRYIMPNTVTSLLEKFSSACVNIAQCSSEWEKNRIFKFCYSSFT